MRRVGGEAGEGGRGAFPPSTLQKGQLPPDWVALCIYLKGVVVNVPNLTPSPLLLRRRMMQTLSSCLSGSSTTVSRRSCWRRRSCCSHRSTLSTQRRLGMATSVCGGGYVYVGGCRCVGCACVFIIFAG